MSSDDPHENVPLAIGLTFAAGFATVLGAAFSFCVKPDNLAMLPVSLAFSAGVMIYVSMVEILPEARASFEEDVHDDEVLAHVYLSLTFFGGIVFGYLLDLAVHALGHNHDMPTDDQPISMNRTRIPTADIDLNGQAGVDREEESEQDGLDSAESKQLIQTSLVTAVAIGLHNFPEGLITFVSTLADPTLGVSVAFAIAIHNFPEGVAVAMPVFFATNSKLKAFLWAFFSGMTEPIGGLIGYGVVSASGEVSGSVFGVLFGFTAGIMVYISFRELLPTARRKDKEDKYTTLLVFLGFLVMDISLILFDL